MGRKKIINRIWICDRCGCDTNEDNTYKGHRQICKSCYRKKTNIWRKERRDGVKQSPKTQKILDKVKILIVKWKWGYLHPWEYLEIASIWVEYYSIDERNMNTKPIDKQIEFMIEDFKKSLQN